MLEYINYDSYCIGVILVLFWIIYSLCTKKYKYFELSNFATIALLLFALPRLIFLLLLLVSANYESLEQIKKFNVELTLGVFMLIIRCVHEICKKF